MAGGPPGQLGRHLFGFCNTRAVRSETVTVGRPVVDVVLPVLDEAEALPGVLEAIPSGFRALVVDNGSSDGSGELAAALGARVVHEPRRGFGAACFAGLTAADTDVVCFMDCDGSLDPADLEAVTAPVLSGVADLSLGARRPERNAFPLHARVANRALSLELRRRTGAALTDLGPMRAARREPLLALGIRDRRFGWPLEMVLRAAAAGWRIEEVEVGYRPRVGRSKVTGTAIGTLRAVRDMAAALR
jgi:glycosyltransferase involved in cell wall biosynthesis